MVAGILQLLLPREKKKRIKKKMKKEYTAHIKEFLESDLIKVTHIYH